MLKENINSIYEMIDSLSDEELFEPHMRKWADEATKTAVWEELKSWSYSVKEVADLLGVDDYLVYELLKKNQIEQVHIWIP